MTTALIIGDATALRQSVVDKVTTTGLFETIRYRTERDEILGILQTHPVQVIFQPIEKTQDAHLDWFQQIQKLEAFRHLPLLTFVGDENQADRIQALEKGASDCLSFATSTEELAARIRIHLRHQAHLNHLRQVKKDLARLALTDSLTGLYNRAFFDAALDSEIARSKRTGKPVSLMMIDLDYFKKINDHYGHQVGDGVLRGVAECIGGVIRKEDVACRYGGEEFIMVFPQTNAPQAHAIASRIHQRVARQLESLPLHPPPTLSIGISCAVAEAPLTPGEFIEQADCALYVAKRNGRNRTEIFSLAAAAMTMRQSFTSGQASYV